jgi:hypothetical protein
LCGFNSLERDERLKRANEILNSTELKQEICHQILGTTFKDVERAMLAVINEKQLTPDQQEELELRKAVPEKYEPEFDPDLEFKINKKAADPKRETGYRTLTREECAALIAASNAPFEPPPPVERKDYPTYTREQVQELMKDHFEYKNREKKEGDAWVSQKTTESVTKTKNTKKRSTSTKD